MSDETDIAAWLLEQIADDERLARATATAWGSRNWYVHQDERGDVCLFDKSSTPVMYTFSPSDTQPVEHIATWDPQRVLAECEAKRRIIEKARAAIQQSDLAPDKDVDLAGGRVHGYATAFEVVLYVLAEPYADRPGWRQEWALDDEGRPAMEDGG